MRIFLSILFLFFSFHSFSKADDIGDFEIEGMYVGDTLLNYYDKEKIKSFYQNSSYYRDKAFAVIFVDQNSNMYDRIQVTLKPGDNKHKIYSLEGIIDFDKEINKCKKKRKEIINDIENIFSDYERLDDDGYYEPDKSKNSFSNTTWFFLKSGGFISVECTEMGDEVRKENGWTDQLSIAITSEKLESFLRGNPY